MSIGLVVGAALQCLAPLNFRPGIFFGVTVDPEFCRIEDAQRILWSYRRPIIVMTVLCIATLWLVVPRLGGPAAPIAASALVFLGSALRSSRAAAAANSSFGIPVEMTVPVAPTPFRANGKNHLVYELHLTNLSLIELSISKFEVLNGDAAIAIFEGVELNNMLQNPVAGNVTDNRVVGPGMRTVAYIWVSLDPGNAVPSSLRHRITGKSLTVTGSRVPVSAAKALVLGPPLRGANWIAVNGPSNTSIHRRSPIPLNGRVRIAQRFAIDWLQVGPNGRPFEGDEKDNKAYSGYVNEVLAVADAVVAATKDGIPENIPGLTSRAVPITLETIGGNHVILDLGGGWFAFYAHMQPGSLRVKLGEKVRRGQVLGLVGNSGNSTAPHLHFHVTDANSPLESEGLPYVFESFERLTAPDMWERRQSELPLQNARVRFPL
jgi:murein DD-endopeptidase MepM/ murein hydrolase activator NlpD